MFFHLTSSDQKVFDSAIEQMSATGFDMVIFSFGLLFYSFFSAPPSSRALIQHTWRKFERTWKRRRARESRSVHTT